MEIIVVAVLCLLAAAYILGQSHPEPRPDQWWQTMHTQFRKNTANNPAIPIIFYGDSITQWWNQEGSAVFMHYYAPLGVANYGIAADRTEHVLWRIENGEVKGLNPRLIVLEIGTNNLGLHSDVGIADGILTIIKTLRTKLPNTRILLLGILPRTGAANFDRIVTINSIISSYHDGQNVFFLDMFEQFRSDVWGVVPPNLFFDGLHLSEAGYQHWADTMNPLFNRLIAK